MGEVVPINSFYEHLQKAVGLKPLPPTATFWTLGPLDPEKERTWFAKLKSFIEKKTALYGLEIIDPLDICPKETRRLLLQKSRLFGDIPSRPIHSPLAAWVHQTPTHGDTSCQLLSTLAIFLPFLRVRGRDTSLHYYEQLYVMFLNAITTQYL